MKTSMSEEIEISQKAVEYAIKYKIMQRLQEDIKLADK